ncbi:MAG TPA: GYD domain-containing protein [Streptosporangiaceae bacterium]|nr:GYD domain-containing protein [Streptosporangiaceae bacterium]
MAKFLMTMSYSSGSWARMLKVADDRVAAVATLLEHLHGSLEGIYWGVETAHAYVIAELPDSLSATAAVTIATETGAFKDVQVHEVLTQEQIRDVVALAKSAEGIYRPPGAAAIENDGSLTGR